MPAARRRTHSFASRTHRPTLLLLALVGCRPAVETGEASEADTSGAWGDEERGSSTGLYDPSEVAVGHYTLTYFDDVERRLVNLGVVVLARGGSGTLWPKDGCENQAEFPLSWAVGGDETLLIEVADDSAMVRSLRTELSGCMDGEARADLVGRGETPVSLARTEGCLSDCRLVACTNDPRVEACGL